MFLGLNNTSPLFIYLFVTESVTHKYLMPGKYMICCFWVKLDKKRVIVTSRKNKTTYFVTLRKQEMILFMCVFTSFCRIYRQSGEIWQHSLSKYLCTYMRFQISALSNDFNDMHFRLINNLHSEDVYSFTSCINSLDAAFKWSGHTYRLWYDIMLIYGKMYSAHLCHFVIRFSAGNLI